MGGKEEMKLLIKGELLGHFKTTGAHTGDVLAREWLYNDFLPSLSSRESKILEEAVNEMIHDGLVEFVGGRQPTYRLTEKGRQSLC